MGVNVSSWQLARAVSRQGQLGVVSGTALDAVLARGLRTATRAATCGGRSGHSRTRKWPSGPSTATSSTAVVRLTSLPAQPDADDQAEPRRCRLSVLGNFAHVWLAKEGHDGIVGINFLEKVQMATPSAALGAMVAGVDYVLMGAASRARSPSC